ncbi:MAG TPA: ROK family protein [Fimbriimonadaceae bacterium]|nr:ROK family protein [Fimbriimonadaceae bacterium]
MQTLWGIDLGGTKIEGAVIPAAGGEALCRLRIDTEQQGGYEHILGRIGKLVDQMSEESELARPDAIGLAMPGTTEPSTGLMKNANTVCLIGKPLIRDLSRLLGCDVVGENDANCFALAEAASGAARGSRIVFGVIMGTGVGGGLVIDGKVVGGHHGIAGEWGHNILVPNGDPCYCGKRGCVETVISGTALERWYFERTGHKKRLREIAASDEPDARATIDRLCDYFGRALASVVNTLDPDAVVLGGGVGNIDALYTRGRESLREWIFNDRFDAKLVKPELGDSAGVFGAAFLTRRTA